MTSSSHVKALISGVFCLFLTACSNNSPYFQNDGPPSDFFGSRDFSHAPNAVPKIETPHKAANRPYTINGKRYVPITGDKPMTQVGIGSWYGKQFHGNKTSIGERYNMYAMTAAHPTMELPSYAKVTNLANGKSVIVRVNDRGPFLHNRIIDLSYAAASKLGYVNKGTAKVKVERIRQADIRAGIVPTGSRVELFDEQTESDLADVVAIASVIHQASEQIKAHNVPEKIEQVITRIDQVKARKEFNTEVSQTKVVPSQNEQFTDSDVINLTEAAQKEMTSTDSVVISTPSSTQETLTEAWSIQAGVFSSLENAQKRAQQLTSQTNLTVETIEEDGKYRVLLGQFKEKESASKEAQKLQELTGEKFVTFKK